MNSHFTQKVTDNFDAAAGVYDRQALLQTQVAEHLVNWATPMLTAPQDILDIGCGTGFLTNIMAMRWPLAQVTALDSAPAMLQQAQQKTPRLKIVTGDANAIQLEQRFDLIFSSMMLHWLEQPMEALQRWRSWLKPQGRLCIALPVEGSFQEWRDLNMKAGLQDGLRRFPPADFANAIADRQERQTLQSTYPSARDFLAHLKPSAHRRRKAGTSRPASAPCGVYCCRRPNLLRLPIKFLIWKLGAPARATKTNSSFRDKRCFTRFPRIVQNCFQI